MKLTTDPHRIRSINQPYTVWHNCFTENELNAIVDTHDESGVYPSHVSSGSVTDYATRKSSSNFHSRTDKNNWIFDRLIHMLEVTNDMFFHYDLIGFEKYQYTVYNTTDYYDYHVDTIFGDHDITRETHLTRKLSISILLNHPDEFEGGNFELCYGRIDEALSFKLDKGTAIFFPSYMLHRVAPITKGVRKSLVVWALGPKFK